MVTEVSPHQRLEEFLEKNMPSDSINHWITSGILSHIDERVECMGVCSNLAIYFIRANCVINAVDFTWKKSKQYFCHHIEHKRINKA